MIETEFYLLGEDSPFYFKITDKSKGLSNSEKVALLVGHCDYEDELLISGHSNRQEAINKMNKEWRKFTNANGPHWLLHFEPNYPITKSVHDERKLPIENLQVNQTPNEKTYLTFLFNEAQKLHPWSSMKLKYGGHRLTISHRITLLTSLDGFTLKVKFAEMKTVTAQFKSLSELEDVKVKFVELGLKLYNSNNLHADEAYLVLSELAELQIHSNF